MCIKICVYIIKTYVFTCLSMHSLFQRKMGRRRDEDEMHEIVFGTQPSQEGHPVHASTDWNTGLEGDFLAYGFHV